MPLIKYTSTTEPDVYFWAEKIPNCEPEAWHVVVQRTGFPATEAHDDWFGKQADAQAVASILAQGKNPDERPQGSLGKPLN